MNATQEQWRPVVGFEGIYEVSDLGRVRSVPRERVSVNGHTRKYPGRIRLLDKDRHGYPLITLSRDGKNVKFPVHQLVARAFIGPKPEGMEVRHLNDVRDDNRAANITYGTRSQNMYDSIQNGTHNRASRDRCCRGHLFNPATTRIRVNRLNGRTFRYCMICDRIRRTKAKGRRPSGSQEYG